jgi:uncharacterized protein YegP (UPF0339 family)
MIDQTDTAPEYYRGKKGEWRWRIKARNGRIVHASSEGFVRLSGARKNFDWLRGFIQTGNATVQSQAKRS